MVPVHEFQDLRSQGPDQPTSPQTEDDRGLSIEAPQPSPKTPQPWIRRHLFTIFLASSLIFHLGLIWMVVFFDPRAVTPWTNLKEIPVELVNEEQAQKNQKPGGEGHADSENNNEAAKQTASSAKPDEKSQAQTEKQAEPAKPAADKPDEQPKTASDSERAESKPVENKPENKSAENKLAVNKPAETKAARNTSRLSNKSAQKPSQSPKETAAKEPAAQEAQKPSAPNPPVQVPPKAVEPTQQQSATPQAQPQQPQPQQEPKPSPGDLQQGEEARRHVASEQSRSQLPLFYQPNDGLTLAVPAPLPTDDVAAEPVSYKLIVFAMLERAKEYPQTARDRHAMGRVTIFFAIDDMGQPRNISLMRSSGEADLDTESLSLIGRAAPFPVPPPGAQREFAITIAFGGG